MSDVQKPPYPLRMPDALREQLQEQASANSRSLNAEIVNRLERSLNTTSSQIDVILEQGGHLSLTADVLEAAKVFSNLNNLSLSEEIVLTLRKAYFGVVAGATLSEADLLEILRGKKK